jgi:hypothetical protein
MYDKSIVLHVVHAKPNSALNVRAVPTTIAQTLRQVSANTPAGRCTGAVLTQPDGDWLQITMYSPVYSTLQKKVTTTGYVRRDVVRLSDQPMTSATWSKEEAQAAANQIVADLRSTAVNLQSAANKIKTLTGDEKIKWLAKWNEIRLSYDLAVACFTKNPQLFQVQTKNAVSGADGVGIIPLIVVLVVVIVGAAAATATYYAMKPSYESSGINLKRSDELAEALRLYEEKNPGGSEVIEKQLEEQLDNAYEAGVDKGNDEKGGLGWGYVLAIGATIFFLSKTGKATTSAAGERFVNYIRPKSETAPTVTGSRKSVRKKKPIKKRK